MNNSRLYKVRYPEISKHFDRYSDYLKSPIKCIVGSDWGNKKEVSTYEILNNKTLNEDDEIFNGTYIYSVYAFKAKEALSQKLDGKIILDNSANSGSNQIPDDPFYYKLMYEDQVIELDDGTFKVRGENSQPYYRIIPSDLHKTVNDLCQNCFKYKLVNNVFVYSDNVKDHIKGFMKGNIRYMVSCYLGDIDERLSDYSKLIYFILSKLDLSDDERAIISKLSKLTPSLDHLNTLVERELLINSIVERILNEDLSSDN